MEYSQKTLEAELLRKQIATAEAEAEIEFSQKTLEVERLRRQIATLRPSGTEAPPLDTLILRSPIEGSCTHSTCVWASTSPSGLSAHRPWKSRKAGAALFGKLLDRKVRPGDRFLVRDAEILGQIGVGKVVWVSDYVGARDFRTKTLSNGSTPSMPSHSSIGRSDTNYACKIVLCERQHAETKEKNRDLSLK